MLTICASVALILSTVSLTHTEQRPTSVSLYQDYQCMCSYNNKINIGRQILVGNPTTVLFWIVVSESWNIPCMTRLISDLNAVLKAANIP